MQFEISHANFGAARDSVNSSTELRQEFQPVPDQTDEFQSYVYRQQNTQCTPSSDGDRV
jgi:hypothetical protein